MRENVDFQPKRPPSSTSGKSAWSFNKRASVHPELVAELAERLRDKRALVLPDYGPHPREALECCLSETDSYEVDRSRERFLFTMHPKGYLKPVP